MDLIFQNLKTLISKYFPILGNDSDFQKYIIDHYTISIIDITDYECLKISLCQDYKLNYYIYIDSLMKGVYTGSEILKTLELMLTNLKEIKYLKLQDQSKIKTIDFSTYYILIKGESWYNSLGFYRDEDKTDLFECYRNLQFEDIINEFEMDLNFDNFYECESFQILAEFAMINKCEVTAENFKDLLSRILSHITKQFQTKYSKNIKKLTGIEIGNIMTKHLKSKNKNVMIFKLITMYYMYIFNYNRFDLIKNIN
jgi:hypothetical protein